MPGNAQMKSRAAAIAEMRSRFIARGYPRLNVLLIVGLSGLAAFLFSAGSLKLGLHEMGLRYFGAMLVGYGTFLGLIGVWIAYQRKGRSVDLDLPDIGGSPGSETQPGSVFGGGRSGGAGASSRWGAPTGGRDGGVDVDVDEAWPLVLAIIGLVGGVLAILYVVYTAPVLLAEVAVDAALVTGLYRKLRRENAKAWLYTALRHTWVPALITGVCLTLAGLGLQWAVPAAHSIGDVWRSLAR